MMAEPFLAGEWNRGILAKRKYSANSILRTSKPKRRSRNGKKSKVRGRLTNATSPCRWAKVRKSDEVYLITIYGGTRFRKRLIRMAYHQTQAHSFSSC